jgi:hypothetical protein
MKKTVADFIEILKSYPQDKFMKVYDLDTFAYYDPELEYIGDEKVVIYADK